VNACRAFGDGLPFSSTHCDKRFALRLASSPSSKPPAAVIFVDHSTTVHACESLSRLAFATSSGDGF
jgi:hypothetical protein